MSTQPSYCPCEVPQGGPKPGWCYRCGGIIGSTPSTTVPATSSEYQQPFRYQQPYGYYQQPSGSGQPARSGQMPAAEYGQTSGASASYYSAQQLSAPTSEEEGALPAEQRAHYLNRVKEHNERLATLQRELETCKPPRQPVPSIVGRPMCHCLAGNVARADDGVRLCWAIGGQCKGASAAGIGGPCQVCTGCEKARRTYLSLLREQNSMLNAPPQPTASCHCRKLRSQGLKGVCFSLRKDGGFRCRPENGVNNYYCRDCNNANCREKRLNANAQAPQGS